MKNVLVYYGWLSSFNSARNAWTPSLVVNDIASHYDVVVLGDGLEAPTHGDYANTVAIIAGLYASKPTIQIFGYVATPTADAAFETSVDQWDALHVNGIFMDEAGYDFGTTRADFNTKVDYIHAKQFANIAFPNAWKLNHIVDSYNDPSYPNATFNPTMAPSHLQRGDILFLESFGIFPNATAGQPSVFEGPSEMYQRALIAWKKQQDYGFHLMCASILGNTDPNGQIKFDYLNKVAVDYKLDGFGSSDYNYGADSAIVKFWDRRYS